ncbi:MAG: hemerythrin domain-containing protein [Gammaproteobacteria bacterium]|nr:hemerythrin domain-containing protein [Gammaproteobacteria bacterium]
MSISRVMKGDHQRCDHLFSQMENDANADDSCALNASSQLFFETIEHHFGIEEEILFPLFEERSGLSGGPTVVMCHEHRQMKQLFSQMRRQLEVKALADFLATSDTLLILMGQHNAKEEQILYKMMDSTLADEAVDLLPRLGLPI